MKKFRPIRDVFTLLAVLAVLGNCGGGGGETANSQPTGPSANSVIMAWDPVTKNADGSDCVDLAGYCIYYGESPGVTKTNSQRVDVGNTLTAEIGVLTTGKTYYFRMTSYDINSNESDISTEELSVTI